MALAEAGDGEEFSKAISRHKSIEEVLELNQSKDRLMVKP
jgi:hypothetical protein